MLTNVDWNASAYDDLSDPMFEWGMEVMSTLDLKGNERVLDAGCGSGRLTEELAKRLPSGQIVALDNSPEMLAAARKKLAAFGSRIEYIHASLEDFPLSRRVDGIFSNAVFHWVPDHAGMFSALHRALAPGGWLVAEFGGFGNLQRALHRAQQLAESAEFRQYFGEFEAGPHFEDVAATSEHMKKAGFNNVAVNRFSRVARFTSRERFEGFLETVVLRQPIAPLSAELRREYLGEMSRRTLAEESEFMLDYVRIQARATA
jgi:trans-aconitate methyltransferase